MARRTPPPGNRKPAPPRAATTNRGNAWLGADLRNEDWDEVLLQAYEHLRSRLHDIEESIRVLEVQREELMNRLAGAEAFLGIADARGFLAPASKPGNVPKPSAYANPHGSGDRKRGSLWSDIEGVMGGQGPMKASDIIDILIEQGYDDSEGSKTRIYNSLGRWAREGKLEKSGRGVYELES